MTIDNRRAAFVERFKEGHVRNRNTRWIPREIHEQQSACDDAFNRYRPSFYERVIAPVFLLAIFALVIIGTVLLAIYVILGRTL